MELVVNTIPKFEDITIKEIKELFKVNSKKVAEGRVLFKTKKDVDKLRSINTAYILLKKFKFKTKKDILDKIKLIDFSFIKKDFVVRCKRYGNHNFASQEIEKDIGAIIFKKGFKVNLKSKEIIYIDIINNNCFIGLLIKDKLCRRDYMLRRSNQGINSCLAYNLIRLSDYKGDILLDPFCKDSTILIEAYLYKKGKIYGFDNNDNIRKSKINAKLAKAKIDFSNVEVDWLDTKFKKNSMDRVVTSLPLLTKRNKDEYDKLIKEFFHQLNYILKKKAVILFNDNNIVDKYLKDYKFKKKQIKLNIGDIKYRILILSK